MKPISDDQVNPTIGIITALPEEYTAVEVMLDNTKPFYVSAGRGAGRQYMLGEVPAVQSGKHSIVVNLADKGNNIAASRAAVLLERFQKVKWVIMVGIACGVPHPQKPDDHVRLGDIIVSGRKGVVKYDFVKETIKEKIPDHLPRPPSPVLYDAVRLLEAAAIKGDRPWLKFIKRGLDSLKDARPSEKTDILYHSAEPEEIIHHPKNSKRKRGEPRVFIGTIASADTVLKNPIIRDELRDKYSVKAVEMEGSGIADAAWDLEADYFVVRGSCDYGDHSKGDDWHMYASIVAAAYTRALLESIPCQDIEYEVRTGNDQQRSPPSLHFITSPDPGFVGRKEFLREISGWYKSSQVRVGALIGLGGMGKSSIARKWFDQVRDQAAYVQKAFWWGFYRNPSLDECLNCLLEYISDKRISSGEHTRPIEKINIIKTLLHHQECLVVFDGFEAIQMRSAGASQDTDDASYKYLGELLKSFAESTRRSFLLVTTRYGLDELRGYEGTQYRVREISGFAIEDAIELFKQSHIRAEGQEIETVWEEFEGHALSLRLLTTLLQEYYDGNIHAVQEIPHLTSKEITVYGADEIDGGKARGILVWYEDKLSEAHRIFLKIFSLFAKPVTQTDFLSVFQTKDDRLRNESLVGLSNIAFANLIKKLTKLHLLTAERKENGETLYDTHPLIREYFSSLLGNEARMCHQALTEYYESTILKSPLCQCK